MKELILPGQDTRLLDKRFEEEHNAQQLNADFHSRYKMGAPEMPNAQIVFNAAKGTFGVAIKGAPFVCQLPKGYAGQGLELAVIDGDRLIAIHPDHPPLLLNPQNGETSRL